ncbi:thiosulfate/3-mercaptopyruvate sulfurtransferase [Natronocella acetinitrilica]|uniref:3-mercaptopyruvate sulfurtransferase n=1 Tax=Natronocella acetinitrilica TaxID=414046 RepID=A0AAE3KH41_9GAMM|nr:3-mercaptopyruvate sulfurtransferase [Natronocella acetinitrilica]MCP1675952.1 thiosulfate/3-mercaptopyruvate sulfurtransferase [Natronocella acetinitrilica]
MNDPTLIVSTEWLVQRLDDPAVIPVDATWYLPGEAGNGRENYLQSHIPGAVYFDIDAISDTANPLPHMLPSEQAFAQAVGALGIGNDSQVVVYDAKGLFSAARVWWMFRAFGHVKVAVLDGGLPKWRREGWPLDSGAVEPSPQRYSARLETGMVADRQRISEGLGQGTVQVADARAAARFEGTVSEPRPGLRSGHIPGSVNLPFSDLLDPATGELLPEPALRRAFAERGIDLEQPLVTSCGSGVTAAVLYLAATTLGARKLELYDGSWAEWGDADSALPIATGPASLS